MNERQYNPRRSFSVKGQLVGKLGQQGFGQLLQAIESVAVEKVEAPPRPKRRRRGGRGRKPVAA